MKIGTNEILPSKMTLLKVKQGYFETAILVLQKNFSYFIAAKGVFKHNVQISFHALNTEYSDAGVKGYIWVLNYLIRISRTVQRM